MEGVMMRSAHFVTIAVRDPNGKIIIRDDQFTPFAKKLKMSKVPIVRGIIALFESLYIGAKSLNFSSKVAMKEKISEKGFLSRKPFFAKISADEQKNKKTKKQKIEKYFYDFGMGLMIILSYILAIGLGLFLFKYIPLLIADLSQKYFTIIADNYILFNTIDGLVKIFIFLGYILAISLFPDIKRVFEFHGAEHKSIMTYEHNLPLTPENATKQTRFHPRCGTSFIFFVLFLSIFIYTLIPQADDFWIKLWQRIAILPLIAGVSYEILKLSAKYQHHFLIKLFIKPGLFFQKFTTKEPDKKELEVGLAALKRALELEKDFKTL
ncbi:hypothetical protein A2335_01055 [Candidatus Peregrinibacteria bacterium RIFOXYB2_FULL_32_7]|nr:MAG: hypothetical protein A2335_01055 [Candidatus Peregrinibacteria bacterium RIFOXYB2_FULL_32_7]